MVEMPAYTTKVYAGWLLVGIGVVLVSSCDRRYCHNDPRTSLLPDAYA